MIEKVNHVGRHKDPDRQLVSQLLVLGLFVVGRFGCAGGKPTWNVVDLGGPKAFGVNETRDEVF